MIDKVIKRIDNGNSIELISLDFNGIQVYCSESQEDMSYDDKIAQAVEAFDVKEFLNGFDKEKSDSVVLKSLDTAIQRMNLFGG